MSLNIESEFERARREGAAISSFKQVTPDMQDFEPEVAQEVTPEDISETAPKAKPEPQQEQQEVVEKEPKKPEKKKGIVGKAFSTITDLAMAPIRGAEGAVEGIYGFVDFITGDRLWDWDRDQHSLFGRSKTTIGGLTEGLVQFGIGFVPGVGAASWLGRASKLGKVGSALSKSKEALKTFSKGTLSLSPSTMKKMSRLKSATKESVKYATAGALSDFFVFKGEEQRLSNLLARYDKDESNAIIQWLAYDPDKDNNELEERFKNALEGAIVGEALGMAFVGVKSGIKALRGFPEKEAAISGIQKTLNTFRDKNKRITETKISGEELDELDAVDKALSNPDNKLTPEEIKAGRELNKRLHDRNKTREYEEITGTKVGDTPRSSDVDEAAENLKDSEAPTVKPIDADKASEEELDTWFRNNTDIAPSNFSLATKREAAKDIIEQSKKGGTEHLIQKLEANVVERVKKAGLYSETNPQAMLSGVRLVRSVPEMRALLGHVSKAALKASKEAEPEIEDMAKFYEETKQIFGLGIESAGGKADALYLEPMRNSVEDIRRANAEGYTVYEAMNAAARDIQTKMNQAEEALERTTVEVKNGKEVKVLNADQAMTELYSAMDRFTALQEIWADMGTQLSLGMRQRQDLYRTGYSSIGRDIAGQHRELGFEIERALSNSGKLFRRMSSNGKSDKRVIQDLKKLFKKSGGAAGPNIGDVMLDLNEVGVNSALSRFILVRRKGLAVSQEWYYNAILGAPTSWIVNLIGGGLVLPLRHIESIAGGLMTGNIPLVKANFRVMFDIQSFSDALKYAWRSGVDDEARSITGYTAFRDDRMVPTNKAIYMDNPDGNVVASAINWLGTIVRHPTRLMMMGDEFFKQMSFRSRIKTALAVEGYQKGLHRDPKKLAEYINNGFEGMITKDGRFRNEDNVRKEALLELEKARKYEGASDDVDGFSINGRQFVDEYMEKHYFDNNLTLEDGVIYNQKGFEERQLLVESGQEWALVNTFTNEVTNPFFKKTGEIATMSPWLGFIIPFVRTPSNILLFALGRSFPALLNPKNISNIRALRGRTAALAKGEADLVLDKFGDMPEAKRMAQSFLKSMQNDSAIKAAEESGRLAFGAMTMAAFLMNIERIADNITGSAPEEPGKKAAWAATGKQPFSIKVGDKWYSYQRLDPFATIIGILADVIHGYKDMRETGVSEFGSEEEFMEKEPYLAQILSVLATSFANNVSNKSYIENLGELLDILEKPTESIGNIGGNIAAGFVPNGINWTQNVYQEEAPIMEARSVLDKMKKRLPEFVRPGEKLMPRRNFLGEIERKESTGGFRGVNPIFSSTVSNDIVDMEIEHQAVGRKTMQAGRNIGGRSVSYRDYRNEQGQTAYDRMQELSGTMRLGPQQLTLRQALRRTIESNDYQNLPPVTEKNKDVNHPRTKELSKIINIYRAEARRRTVDEFEELKSDLLKLLQ